jgi:hypothetical protein
MFYEFDKCILSWTHHYNIIRIGSPSQKILYLHLVDLPTVVNSHNFMLPWYPLNKFNFLYQKQDSVTLDTVPSSTSHPQGSSQWLKTKKLKDISPSCQTELLIFLLLPLNRSFKHFHVNLKWPHPILLYILLVTMLFLSLPDFSLLSPIFQDQKIALPTHYMTPVLNLKVKIFKLVSLLKKNYWLPKLELPQHTWKNIK